MAQSKFLSLTGLDTYDAKIKDWVEKKGYTTPEGHNHDGRYYTETEVNNLLNNYLKLAGGTISGTLTINRDASAIHYNNSSGTSWGWMGFKAKDTPAVWENTGTTSYNILHAGNSGVSLSGSTLTVKINGTEHSLTNTNTTYDGATQSAAGLMSAADKKKLDGIAAGANAYSLPLAADGTRGGIQIGYSESGANIPLKLSSEKGYVTLTKNSVTNALGYTPPTTNTTYGTATQSASGLMSYDDKKKLDGIAAGANAYSLPTASASTLGGIKIGDNLSITNGVLSAPYTSVKYGTTASNTGFYKIKINSTTSWMLAFNVRVYQGYIYHDIRFSGYNYGNSFWYQPKASLVNGDASVKVYMGHDSAYNLWVAIPANSYTGIEIADCVNGYTQTGLNNDKLFTITNVSTLSGTTDKEYTLYPPSTTDHTHNYAAASHNHDGTYAAASHNHAASNITSGVLALARIPTGTSAGSVALGNHTHNYAAASHGNHVPATQTANNAIFLRNDNTWQTVTPANIGAAAASHGNHVPTTQTANNAVFLRNDNTWQTVTPANIGAATSSHNHNGTYAPASHTHSYLPLDGGTLNSNKSIIFQGTGGIHYKGSVATYPLIQFIDNSADGNGNGIKIGGGGSTLIGGGESADQTATLLTNGGNERMIISNDQAIDFYTNCQSGIGSAKSFSMGIDGKLYCGSTAVSLEGHTHNYAAASHGAHIPSGGSSGQFLAWSSAGTAKWVNNPNTDTTYTFTDANPTLSWGTKSKVATIGGTDIHVTMPANPNTDTTYSNATTSKAGLMSAADKTKLDGINLTGGITKPDGNTGSLQDALDALKTLINNHSSDTNAHKDTVYTHPTTAGNKHIPSGGSSGQFLAWSSAGTAKWVNNPNTDTVYTHPTTTGNKHIPSGGSSGQFLGWSSDGTAKWVNNPNTDTKYTAGTNISISSSNVISATDTTYSAATQSAAGLMSAADKTKLDGIASGANAYTHPTTAGNKHIPSGGSSGQFLAWSSAGTAQWVANPNSDTNVRSYSTTSTYYLCGSTSSVTATGTLVKRSTVYVNTSSAVYASGGFYESSDERLKTFGDPIEVDLEKIKKLPKKYFTWKNDKDNKLNIGTSAQELQKLYPEVVSEGADGYLNVNYEKLSIVALAAIDKLQDKYDKKIQELEDKLNKVLELIK